MADLSGLVTGLSQGLSQYLQGNINQQRQQQNTTFDTQQKTQQAEDLAKFNQAQEPTVSMDMAEQMLPGMGGKWQQNFQQQNNRPPTLAEASDAYKNFANQGKPDKSNIKHYMGNSPSGDAIFSDNEGNMFGPDKQPYAGKVLPKSSTMPTSQARSTGEFASTIRPHIVKMRDLIQEADQKGYIGPTSGRIYNQFMAGKVGTTGNEDADRLLGKLRSMDMLMKSGAMKVHFGSRGGQLMYEHFSDMLNTGKQSAALLNGNLDTLDEFMMGYEKAGSLTSSASPAENTSNTNNLEAKKAALRAKLGL